MIQSALSRSNQPMFTWDQRYLCSRVDPVGEAKDWVSRYRAQVQSCSEIIVIGLGCGFHILEMLKEFNNKKIIVIESRAEIWSWFSKNYPIEAVNFKCIVIDSEEDLLDSKLLMASLKKFYTLLTHTPSLEAFPELKLYQKWLLGRSYDSLTWLAKIRSENKIWDWQMQSFYDVNKEGLTLLDLSIKSEQNKLKIPADVHHKLLALKELIV